MSVRLLYSYVTLKVLDFVSWKTTFYCDYSSVEKTLLSYTSVDSLLFFLLASDQLLLSWFSLVEWMLPGPLSLLLMLFSSFKQFLLTSSDVLKMVNTKRFMGPMLEKRYKLINKKKTNRETNWAQHTIQNTWREGSLWLIAGPCLRMGTPGWTVDGYHSWYKVLGDTKSISGINHISFFRFDCGYHSW